MAFVARGSGEVRPRNEASVCLRLQSSPAQAEPPLDSSSLGTPDRARPSWPDHPWTRVVRAELRYERVCALSHGYTHRVMDDKPAPTKRNVIPTDRTRTVRVVIGMLLLVVLVAVVVDNKDDTRVGYVFGDFEAPLFVVVILAAIIGALVGWLFLHRPRRHRDT
jgi:uncharacterized integral membrane protein